MTGPSAADLHATVRKGFNGIRTVRDLALAKDALDALLARCQQAEEELAHLKSEWSLDHDRGDHLVYRREWEAFDAWQRGDGLRDNERLIVLAARVAELEQAIDTAIHNIGVPSSDYPAPIGHAYDVLVAALQSGGTTEGGTDDVA